MLINNVDNINSKISDIMSDGGLLSKKLQNYNERKSQIVLASNIYEVFDDGKNLLAEAPTGIGKSLAGLIPSIIMSLDRGYKVVISTSTKALQNQYYEKDLPFLHKMFDGRFSYAMMKGRSNYLCKRRFNAFYNLFISERKIQYLDTIDQYNFISSWMESTPTGDLETLGFEINSELRNEIVCDVDYCDGKDCSFNDTCFYNRCKANAKNANVLLVNTDLFCIDLVVRNTTPASILPTYDLVVVDEAHTFENIFSKYVGFKISPYSVKTSIGYAEKYAKMCRANVGSEDKDIYKSYYDKLLEIEKDILKYSKRFFGNFQFDNDKDTIRLHSYDYDPKTFVYGRKLITYLRKFSNAIHVYTNSDKLYNMSQNAISKIDDVCSRLEKVVNISDYEYDFVFWVTYSKKGEPIIECAPIDVSDILKNYLFERPDVTYWNECFSTRSLSDKSATFKLKPRSVVMMSATLTTNHSFHFIMKRLGIEYGDTETIELKSDFDYNHHCLLYVPSGIIEPNSNKKMSDAFTIQTANNIIRLIKVTHGKMLCLFTSYSEMEKVYDIVSNYGFKRKYNILNQNQMPKNKLVEVFKNDVDSILFATSSFWTGVDFQGETLSALVIDRIPFVVPSEPIIEARIDRIKSKGGDWFNNFYIPMAIMTFCQGFGRLIRTKDDMGIVMICDKRIVSKGYGKKFINSLPNTKQTRKFRKVKVFWDYVCAKRNRKKE